MADATTGARGGSGHYARALHARYIDAYRVATFTSVLGTATKIVGGILGSLILLISATSYDRVGAVALLGGIIGGGALFAVFFVLGVLIAAHGQVLKATLDTAVNSSPLLDNQAKARLMSLRPTRTDRVSPSTPRTERSPASDTPSDDSEETAEFCYHCGADIPAKSATCPACGKSL